MCTKSVFRKTRYCAAAQGSRARSRRGRSPGRTLFISPFYRRSTIFELPISERNLISWETRGLSALPASGAVGMKGRGTAADPGGGAPGVSGPSGRRPSRPAREHVQRLRKGADCQAGPGLPPGPNADCGGEVRWGSAAGKCGGEVRRGSATVSWLPAGRGSGSPSRPPCNFPRDRRKQRGHAPPLLID